ncbi:small proline-rich protein 2B-like [Eleutherodactylus coqui]|uniref:Uncharacterized protein n=1 Tax=Eleutherodactylus coqui TaxID=57060 RepID=A0A8J6EGH8_ELECQ|nr:hypothetical protein GDO78_022106 [Eleutherodactylus coqui]
MSGVKGQQKKCPEPCAPPQQHCQDPCEPEPVQCQAPPKCPSPQVCVPEPVCEPKAPPQVICSQSNQKQDMGVKK